MKLANQLLQRIRDLIGGWDKWSGNQPVLKRVKDACRISCGDGRYNPAEKTGLISRRLPAVLHFEIICNSSAEISRYSIGLHYTDDSGLGLMFHLAPDKENWPSHPLHHVHVEANSLAAGKHLGDIRLPFGETEALKILAYLIGLCSSTETAEMAETAETAGTAAPNPTA